MRKKRVDGRSISRDAMEHFRFRALELRKKGWKVNDIAESFGMNRSSVSRWFTKSQRGGKEALQRRYALGAQPKLTMKDVQKVLSCVKQPATNFNFETPLWDCRRIQQLIRTKCKKKLHISNVWRLLYRWKFTAQKPQKSAIEQSKELVKKWLKKEWPLILRQAQRWRAIVYFQDEAGVSLIPVLGTTWAPRGETPRVSVTGNKGGLCLTSAISRSGRLLFRIEKETINSEKHIEFLEQIIEHHPNRKIIVIEDRAPAHRAALTQKFVQQHKERFALYLLPAYSPDLNPDEKTWNYLKNKKLKTHQATTITQLRTLVLAKMRNIQQRPELVKSFFYDSYAA